MRTVTRRCRGLRGTNHEMMRARIGAMEVVAGRETDSAVGANGGAGRPAATSWMVGRFLFAEEERAIPGLSVARKKQ